MFAQSFFALPALHNMFRQFFAWALGIFTCFPILEGYITRITNYDYDKYLSISTWGKLCGSCDEKLEIKHQKSRRVKKLNCKL